VLAVYIQVAMLALVVEVGQVVLLVVQVQADQTMVVVIMEAVVVVLN
jgi:hypothetical protein